MISHDNFGHDTGDQLLKIAAEKLRRIIRKSDIIFRMGGDEFLVIITKILSKTDAEIVAKKIQHEFTKPTQINSKDFLMGVSIGIFVNHIELGDEPSEIVRKADLAMYKAKQNGKNNYQIFQQSMVS